MCVLLNQKKIFIMFLLTISLLGFRGLTLDCGYTATAPLLLHGKT